MSILIPPFPVRALRRLAPALWIGWAIAAGGCSLLFPADRPIALRHHPGASPPKTLLVMLPGITDRAADFSTHGFIGAARRRGFVGDIVLADAHFGYYLADNIVRRLERDVIGPARRVGYRHIWLVGVSLGGLGSFLYAMEYPQRIDGIVAIAPYLGGEGFVEELEEAGGVRHWQASEPLPDPRLPHVEPGLWSWLKGYPHEDDTHPPIILAYGENDRYADAHRQLARLLPEARVVRLPGGHGWQTWTALWRRVLERPAFLPAQPPATAVR